MDNISIKINFNGIDIEACFNNKLNILVGHSGTGKTLLMKAIELYCLNNGIKNIYCDSSCLSLSEEQINIICSDKKVVLLDNADLYLTNNLLKQLNTGDKTIIICMKDVSELDVYDASEYLVNYSNKKLTVREI